MPGDLNYCHRCGHGLLDRHVEGRIRPYCANCGLVVFLDPKLAAVVIVCTKDQLVLVRRGIEPAMGRWSFPSGYVDRGEAVEDAAIREVKEETGLDIRVDRLIGIYSRHGGPVALAVYSAAMIGGAMEAGAEVEEVALFPIHELPPLPFPHDYAILADWQVGRSER